MSDETSARGTPNTVRPSIGLGAVPADPKTAHADRPRSGHVIVPGIDLAKHIEGSVVHTLKQQTATVLLRDVSDSLGRLMGLTDAELSALLRDVADALAREG